MSYSLDPVGNRLSQASSLHNVPTVGFSYGPDDTLLGETYDGNGNVTATGGKTFSYDSQNELISANGGAVTVEYDGFGNRVSKTANGVTTRYLVEDDVNPTGYPQVFDELTGSTVTRTYTYGLQRISEDQPIDNVWTPSFYGYDGFGTVRQLTNTAGAVTDTFEYDAFGNAITHTGTTPNNYLYRGEQYDSDLGLYYLRARYYNPLTGRFMSRDPEDAFPPDPSSLNKYLYVGGDPVNWDDPSGEVEAAPAFPNQGADAGVGDYVILVLKALASTVAVAEVGCGVEFMYSYVTAKVVKLDYDVTRRGCEAYGYGRMRIQLQFGQGKQGITVQQVTQRLLNLDPPGVTLTQVGTGLAEIWALAKAGAAAPFPKTLNWDLKPALVEVSVCAFLIREGGGVIGGERTVCQGLVGKSGWRVDLDQENGYNLTQ